jgi:fibronectin type 3 domain-containing protein
MRNRLFTLALMCVAATSHAQAANQAVLTWTAPTTYSDGTPLPASGLAYKVYRGLSGATKTVIASPTTTTYTDTGQAQGTTVCYQVSATLAGQESALSTEACKTFPALAPSAPSALRVQ